MGKHAVSLDRLLQAASPTSSGQDSCCEEACIDLTKTDRSFIVRMCDRKGSTRFRLRPSTPLSALLAAYAKLRELAPDDLKLTLGVQMLAAEDTAAQASLSAESVLGVVQVL